MKFYFKLQLKRYYRILKEAGFNPYITSFTILFLFIILSELCYARINFAEYVYPVIGLILIFKLGHKNRNNFLKNCFNIKKFSYLRLAENGLIALPFFTFLIYKNELIIGLSFLLTALLLSFFNASSPSAIAIPTPFYKRPFEFTIGFRKTFLGFIGAYALAIIAVSVGNFNLGIVALLMTFLSCTSFYSHPEPQFYVWIHSQNPTNFLEQKLKTASLFSIALSLPITILLAAFNFNNAHFVFLFEIIGVFYVINSLLGKYAYYPSEININKALTIAASIFFPPLMLLTIPFFYKKSKQELNSLLK